MTVDKQSELLGWVIAALLSALIVGSGSIWAQQRTEIVAQQIVITKQAEEIGTLEEAAAVGAQDRGQLRERLIAVEDRQQRVIGVLTAIDPKATAAMLEQERR